MRYVIALAFVSATIQIPAEEAGPEVVLPIPIQRYLNSGYEKLTAEIAKENAGGLSVIPGFYPKSYRPIANPSHPNQPDYLLNTYLGMNTGTGAVPEFLTSLIAPDGSELWSLGRGKSGPTSFIVKISANLSGVVVAQDLGRIGNLVTVFGVSREFPNLFSLQSPLYGEFSWDSVIYFRDNTDGNCDILIKKEILSLKKTNNQPTIEYSLWSKDSKSSVYQQSNSVTFENIKIIIANEGDRLPQIIERGPPH